MIRSHWGHQYNQAMMITGHMEFFSLVEPKSLAIFLIWTTPSVERCWHDVDIQNIGWNSDTHSWTNHAFLWYWTLSTKVLTESDVEHKIYILSSEESCTSNRSSRVSQTCEEVGQTHSLYGSACVWRHLHMQPSFISAYVSFHAGYHQWIRQVSNTSCECCMCKWSWKVTWAEVTVQRFRIARTHALQRPPLWHPSKQLFGISCN